MTTCKAGAARRLITPQLGEKPVFLAGFSGDRRATSVNDDLYARALALSCGDAALVLVACDLIGLPHGDVLQMRADLIAAVGQSPIELIVACTHTHSGPDTLGLWGPDDDTTGCDAAYLLFVRRQVVAAALEALEALRPARMCQANAPFPGWVKNLRTPDLVDDELAVLRFEDEGERHIATLLNLACHPEVLPDSSHALSGDFAGAACRALEEHEGGVALFVPGALGGMLSPSTENRTPEGARLMGEALCAVALAALGPARAAQLERLAIRRAALTLPFENPLFAAAVERGLLRVGPTLNLAACTIATELAYADLGAAQIITVPGELLPRLGFEIKRAMPGPCRLLIGLADDELGYILPDDEYVPPQDYRSPGEQYEESMSLGPRTGSLVVGAALALIGADPATGRC
jgi:hypothetical protein